MNFVSCTMNPCDVIVHALKKKKKRKLVNADAQSKPHLNPVIINNNQFLLSEI